MSNIKINHSKLTDQLPRGSAYRIEKLLRRKVKYRQIMRVLNGEEEDLHGIRKIAIKMIEEEIKRREKKKGFEKKEMARLRRMHNTKTK